MSKCTDLPDRPDTRAGQIFGLNLCDLIQHAQEMPRSANKNNEQSLIIDKPDDKEIVSTKEKIDAFVAGHSELSEDQQATAKTLLNAIAGGDSKTIWDMTEEHLIRSGGAEDLKAIVEAIAPDFERATGIKLAAEVGEHPVTFGINRKPTMVPALHLTMSREGGPFIAGFHAFSLQNRITESGYGFEYADEATGELRRQFFDVDDELKNMANDFSRAAVNGFKN